MNRVSINIEPSSTNFFIEIWNINTHAHITKVDVNDAYGALYHFVLSLNK
jgi:hypothetical protein